MARPKRVFIDTSELFPFTVMDVLLTFCEDRLFNWTWTDEVLDEWEDVIVREGMRSRESARSVTEAVRTYFGRYRIPSSTYRGRATDHLSPDPGDRLHAAACIYGNVAVLLTRNLKDFRAQAIGEAGVQVMTADDFFLQLLNHRRQAVVDSFVHTAKEKKHPEVHATELAEKLANAGAPRFAQRLKSILTK